MLVGCGGLQVAASLGESDGKEGEWPRRWISKSTKVARNRRSRSESRESFCFVASGFIYEVTDSSQLRREEDRDECVELFASSVWFGDNRIV